MRTVVINTGTEILLGDVLNTHLTFIAQEIFPLGLRIDEQRSVPDGDAIQSALADVFPRADLIFVTGGLGPTTDDITRELVAELLGLELIEDKAIRYGIESRLRLRKIPITDRIFRQAMIPKGGSALPNANGTAPGIFLPANVNPSKPSPHLFLLPGPPRELRPMFGELVLPRLRLLVPDAEPIAMRKFRLANIGESTIERKIGEQLLAVSGLELGYCSRPGEVDLRLIGSPAAVAAAAEIVLANLADTIFSEADEDLAQVIVQTLTARGETLALAESCTGGLLAHRITNVPGSSAVLLAGAVTYANEEKIRALGVPADSIEQHGAVSEIVAREMAEGMRSRTNATYALATTGIAGPGGGSEEKPVGTAFIALASERQPTRSEKIFMPTDRETFKQMIAQRAFDLLRKALR